ncbi:hypothetical protein CW713_04535 [Methanophagales archaeon]|nr:MAG: hypothetical protein CW713_04535 [Methanophagales archaeon]
MMLQGKSLQQEKSRISCSGEASSKQRYLQSLRSSERRGFLDDKAPPPGKIYEELIEKFGYSDRISLHKVC